ncbi:MAG: hypothetical protein ACYSR0_09555 [Planctomycetota bacterium]|jgi:hypothetical protein
MARFDYKCETEVICNDNNIFPAMKELVEKEGMPVQTAAKFVEKDSKGMVSMDRASAVYRHRIGTKRRLARANSNESTHIDDQPKTETVSVSTRRKQYDANRPPKAKGIDDDFNRAFEAFFAQLSYVRKEHWDKTHKEAVAIYIGSLLEVIK